MRTIPRVVRIPALVLCLAALVAPGLGRGGAAESKESLAAAVTLEPVEIRIGDTARLTVTVEHPAGAILTLPGIERGKAIQVIERQQTTVALPGGSAAGRERTTFLVSFTSFEVGEHAIGGGAISGTDPAGASLAAPFPATVLRTRSVLSGENTPMRGAREPLRWPAPLRRWVGPAVGIMLLLVAAILIGARRRRSTRRPLPAAPPVAALPHETALKALAALRRRNLADRDQVDLHFRELSSIVRRYLEERFGLRAPERTTEELVREAAGSGLLAPAHQELVQDFLSECDLVKFARHRPATDDLSRAVVAAERLVRETKPHVERDPARGKKAPGR